MGKKIDRSQMIPGNNYVLSGYTFTFLERIKDTQGKFRFVKGTSSIPAGHIMSLGMYNWEEESEPINNAEALSFLDKEW